MAPRPAETANPDRTRMIAITASNSTRVNAGVPLAAKRLAGRRARQPAAFLAGEMREFKGSDITFYIFVISLPSCVKHRFPRHDRRGAGQKNQIAAKSRYFY
jgi:hypothetical protein